MYRPNEFCVHTKEAALARQGNLCASCGTHIAALGNAGRSQHAYGEGARAHHVRHIKHGGSDTVDNCVILCESCHYCVHEGGNYRFGEEDGRSSDYTHFSI